MKRAAGGLPETLPHTICAFANMPEGGTIILGVDERSGFQITGVPEPAKLEAALVKQARDAVSPAPAIETTLVTVNGHNVVIADVLGLSIVDRPARYRQRAYLRQSDGDYEMADHELRMIEVAKLHVDQQVHYDDREIPGTSVQDLDSALLRQFLGAVREGTRRLKSTDDEELLRLMRVSTGSGELTLAGSYALGFFPQGANPALSVTAAVQLPRDGSGARTRNLETFTGPLPVLLEDVLDWVRANISADQVYRSDGNLEIKYEFPMSAVREAIANALVHRDLGPNTLGMGKSVEVRLTDQALIIISPGGLRGLTVQQLRSLDLSKAAVNQRLYEIARHLRTSEGAGVIEGEGGGVREIVSSTRDADLPAPEFIDTGVQFVVKLWRGPVFTSREQEWFAGISPGEGLTNLQKTVLSSLVSGDDWSMPRVLREFSPIDEDQARIQIARLADLGQLVLAEDGRISRSSESETVEPEEEKAQATEEPDTLSPEELGNLGKNVPVVYAALRPPSAAGEGMRMSELSEQTGLSVGQVRYALQPLLREGIARMIGGQGARDTSYQLV